MGRGVEDHRGFRLRKTALARRDPAQQPPRLLSFTFDVVGSGEPPTEVTLELAPPASPVAANAPVVRLTLTQAGFGRTAGCFSPAAPGPGPRY